MSDVAMRNWCAQIQYSGLKPATIGTVSVRRDAQNHEVRQAIEALAREHVPEGFTILSLIPGLIVFIGEDEAP